MPRGKSPKPKAESPKPKGARILVKVVNMRHSQYDVRCDRTARSVLGNPYKMAEDGEEAMTRGEACKKYKEYFDEQVADPKSAISCALAKIVARVVEQGAPGPGNTLRLGCWCAPKQCHAETIAEYLQQKIDEAFGVS